MAKSKIKTFTIKVPVYTSRQYDKDDVGEIFGKMTYDDMIEGVKTKILSSSSNRVIYSRNKVKQTVISDIRISEKNIEGRPCLLLNISSYDTNLGSGYYQDENNNKYQFSESNRLGSDNNYMLIYPIIGGLDSSKYTCYYLFLMYDDPRKDSGDVIRLCKHVVNTVLDCPIENIKLPQVIEELKKVVTIPELSIRYKSIVIDDDQPESAYKQYLVHSEIKKDKKQAFKAMPVGVLSDILEEDLDVTEYQSREVKVKIGRKEYEITREILTDTQELKDTAEMVYNASVSLTDEELRNLYDEDFIMQKLMSVLTNYKAYE